MAASFSLSFTYDISYQPSDVLYFGMNLLLGCREFPLRQSGGKTGSGNDKSPRSSKTFNFTGKNPISIDSDDIFDGSGLADINREMLYSDDSNSSELTFRIGSVALKQIVGFNPNGGNLNAFFDDQFTEISNIALDVDIQGNGKTTLIAKPSTFRLGKQHGEIFIFSWSSFTERLN